MNPSFHLKKLIPIDWQHVLNKEFEQEYWLKLETFLTQEITQHTIYPEPHHIFAALNSTPFKDVKVLILGQDPYHNDGQAHGLSFSVQPTLKIPPSLRNIYKELSSDLGCSIPNHGHLMAWAKQGVLLLNSVLTVRAHQAASHKKKGWEIFTDAIIRELNNKKFPTVFVLWGGFARAKKKLITQSHHLILEGAHPSPLSAYNGFWGSAPFSKINQFLKDNGLREINWEIPQK